MLDQIGQFVFPPQCPITGDLLTAPGLFSAAGWRQLSLVAPPGCQLCGAPWPQEDPGLPLCAPCAAPERFRRNLCGPRRLDGTRSALAYNKVAAELILALKYGDRHDLAITLGRLLVRPIAALDLPRDAVLAPVPLHRSRLRARRYNQAVLLARAAAPLARRPVRETLIQRNRPTPQQKGLGFDARFRNLMGAFSASEEARGLAVVLVDDVLTSGATLIGCARALRRAGARSVHAVTVARVFPEGKDAQVDLPET